MDTIIIKDIEQVMPGDMFYAKNCDTGYKVIKTKKNHLLHYVAATCFLQVPFMMKNQYKEYGAWAHDVMFDYAKRLPFTWPDVKDDKPHFYKGSDEDLYAYMPREDLADLRWTKIGTLRFSDRKTMQFKYQEALPLTELKLVTKEEES